MTTVIGLKSGKEFVVKDKCYSTINKTTGLITRIFISPDEKRLITIPPDGVVEYFDEPYNSEAIDLLNKSIEALKEEIELPVEVDVNVG